MTKKSKIILFIVILFFVCFIILRMEEDTWICRNGEWVKHGVPAAAMPEGQCNWLDNLNPL